jgi:hypothetical protein
MAAPFFDDALVDDGFHFVGLPVEKVTLPVNRYSSQVSSKVVWSFRCKWTVDTLPHGQKLSFKCRLKLRVPITLKQKALFILLECWTRSG